MEGERQERGIDERFSDVPIAARHLIDAVDALELAKRKFQLAQGD
jgi:hypothetical protein